MSSSPHQDRDDLVDAMVSRSARTAGVAIRNVFVQKGARRKPEPGLLHHLVRAHDERALDLYLLHRMLASSADWDVRLDARVWARALGLPTPADDGASAVSKTWGRLAGHHLITKKRSGRLTRVTALHEAGENEAYTYPSGHGTGKYFQIPLAYWTSDERWYRTLSLPGKAVLLIASSLKPGFVLPQDQIRRWYGISADTGAKGLHELDERGVLEVAKERREDLFSPTKYVIQHRYTLTGDLRQTWLEKDLATVTPITAASAEA